ncbi:MAG TPA: methionyl-tRNA formyltransferase [Spirochaetota bacterium]|nr:methionyl-tRNA formyltransferase [Spirochaetota bacterium]
MRTGFFGTPQIAAYCLDEILKEYTVSCVVTSPDKPAGRGRKLTPSPVKDLSLKYDIPVLQPQSLKDPSLHEQMKEFECDLFIVVAYGKIIPRLLFDMPRYGTINLHPSLLPLYRGAAPIQWAIINGEKQTGITVQRINEELDAGEILLQNSIDIPIDMTAGELYDLVLPKGAAMLLKTIAGLQDNTITPEPQDHSRATYCGKIDTETAGIDWNNTSMEIHNLVRGLNPRPVAWTIFRDKKIKIWRTMPVEDTLPEGSTPGSIHKFPGKRLIAQTGSGSLEIFQLQPETKKSMDSRSFLNGYHPEKGEAFSS